MILGMYINFFSGGREGNRFSRTEPKLHVDQNTINY